MAKKHAHAHYDYENIEILWTKLYTHCLTFPPSRLRALAPLANTQRTLVYIDIMYLGLGIVCCCCCFLFCLFGLIDTYEFCLLESVSFILFVCVLLFSFLFCPHCLVFCATVAHRPRLHAFAEYLKKFASTLAPKVKVYRCHLF